MFYRNLLGLAVLPCALQADAKLERARNEFSFHLDVPYAAAAPLFGAEAEKKWDPDWQPEFLYPTPAADQEGSIFAVSHQGHRAIWTTTVFDLEHGHVQYLYFIEGALVTRIDIRLTKPATGGTDVRVLYERTAIDASANAHVRELGQRDAKQGPQWKRAIEAIR